MNRRQDKILRGADSGLKKLINTLMRERNALKAELEAATDQDFSKVAGEIGGLLESCNGMGETEAELGLLKELVIIHREILKERNELKKLTEAPVTVTHPLKEIEEEFSNQEPFSVDRLNAIIRERNEFKALSGEMLKMLKRLGEEIIRSEDYKENEALIDKAEGGK